MKNQTSPISTTSRISFLLLSLAIILAIIASLAASAHAQTLTTLYNMGDTQPNSPYAGVAADKAGNLYGATLGGDFVEGVVYKLTYVSGEWQASVIYNFTGAADGGHPSTTPIFDAAGNLYGATQTGGILGTPTCGSLGCGVVYKLSPVSGGGWQESVLYSFTGGADGEVGGGNLIFDKAGNLYGSNSAGADLNNGCSNTEGCGVIFRLGPTSEGSWKFDLLHTFDGNGVGPAPLIFDAAGHLYGSAAGEWGGFEAPSGPGLVFQLTNVAGKGWMYAPVYQFQGLEDGGLPSALIMDKEGNFYGTGAIGGILDDCYSGIGPEGCGVVFKISPVSGGKWKDTPLYAFTGGAGGSPSSGVVFDKGKLYGTSWTGGTCCGLIFALAPAAGGEWTETVPFTFDGTDGQSPFAPLLVGKDGNLYGTTLSGGANLGGTVFELTP
jgi:uncharacterized repeat protein (TIGR03803 family)